MDTRTNMEELGISLEAETGDIHDHWMTSYSAVPEVQSFITYGMLRQGDNGGRAALKNWPQGPLPMAVQWKQNVTRLCKTEIADRGTKFARYNPDRAVSGLGSVEIFRIAGTRGDVARYRRNLDSLEIGYEPVDVPVYRFDGSDYVLDGNAVLYLAEACQAGERPSKAGFKELHERIGMPFALTRGNDGSPWYVGRRKVA